MSNYKVTVITACLNAEKTIENTILSLISQSYKNIEYIIIDGGSTDKTLEKIEKYKSYISKIISEKDNGISDAWNKGLKFANGDFITFLNADDYLSNKAIERASKYFSIAKKEDSIIYGRTIFVDNKDNYIKANYLKFDIKKLHKGLGFMHTTCFFTRTIFDRVGIFSNDYTIAVDSDFLLRAHFHGIKFISSNNITYMRVGGISDKYAIKAQFEYYKSLIKNLHFKKVNIRYKFYFLFNHFFKKIINIKTLKKVRLQLIYIFIWLINIIINFPQPFFFKKLLLSILNIKIGSNSYIHSNVRFLSFGNLFIGNNTTVNKDCVIDNRLPINIGSNVSISSGVKIFTLGHDIDDPLFIHKGKEVNIKNNTVIFTNSMIMPGVTVGEGAVIFPGSVVVKDVESYTVVGGNPAKFIRYRDIDKVCYKIDYGYWFSI